MNDQDNHPALASIKAAVSPLGIAAPGGAASRPAPVLRSRELFRGNNTVRIEHDGQHYLLRLTRGNKLILTK